MGKISLIKIQRKSSIWSGTQVSLAAKVLVIFVRTSNTNAIKALVDVEECSTARRKCERVRTKLSLNVSF